MPIFFKPLEEASENTEREPYNPNEIYMGTDNKFQILNQHIYNKLKGSGKKDTLDLYVDDIGEIAYGETSFYPGEYIYKDYQGDDFGSTFVDDLAQFLNVSVNEITNEDVENLNKNKDKFLQFLCDKYFDEIKSICEDDEDFLANKWREEEERLY